MGLKLIEKYTKKASNWVETEKQNKKDIAWICITEEENKAHHYFNYDNLPIQCQLQHSN